MRKILLVDDEKIMHDLAMAYLEREGYNIVSAFNGKEGLKMILSEQPDVVLLDYMMPGLNGEQVYQELSSNPKYRAVRKTPVILLTANGCDDSLKTRLLQQGVLAYLQKPFGLRELTNIIENIFIINDMRRDNQLLKRAVRTSRDIISQVVHNAPVGIIATNRAGKVTQINRHALKVLQAATSQSVNGLNILENDELRNTFLYEGVSYVLSLGKPWLREVLYWSPRFATRSVLNVHFVPMRSGNAGVVEGVIGIIEDITEKQKAQLERMILSNIAQVMQEARNIDEVLQLLLSAATAGQGLGFTRAMVFLYDEDNQVLRGTLAVGPASSEDARKIWEDLSHENIEIDHFLRKYGRFGAKNSSVLNQRVRKITIPIDTDCQLVRHFLENKQFRSVPRKNERESLHPACAPEQLRELELEDFVSIPLHSPERLWGIIIADNKYGHVKLHQSRIQMLSLAAAHAANAMVRIAAFKKIEDDNRKLEQALRELRVTQEKLIHAERLAAIGEMAAHVAHEIRNPLVTIGGWARRLAQQAEQNGKSKDIDPARIIVDEVVRLESILANVLNFTKPNMPRLVPGNINTLVQELCTQLKPEYQKKGIRCSVQLQKDIPDTWYDPDQIKQVLLNLLQNSLQSIAEGGKIGIETYLRDRDIEITVSDNGRGIPKSVLESIFNPFFTTKEHGTGLGLAISRRIIHNHGGEITANSEPGKGSVFKICLPIDLKPEDKSDDSASLHEMIL